QRRITASAVWNRPFKLGDRAGNWQTTFAWGRNQDHPGRALDGFLVESAAAIGRHTLVARAETVREDHLFVSPGPLARQTFQVSEATLGYVYDIPVAEHVAFGLGLQGTVNRVPTRLQAAYGDDPAGFMPFLRLKVR